jgi:NAD(P)-dependent dehydrogenase (short-subunit alcohol dehydrogenase family)
MATPVVLITGALAGIGRATAMAFAQQGARLVVSGRNDEVGLRLVTELRAGNTEAEFVRADVRQEEDVRGLVDRAVERFGRLDVAVNKRRHRRTASAPHGTFAGDLRRNFRHQCAGDDLELEARVASYDRSGKRQHH